MSRLAVGFSCSLIASLGTAVADLSPLAFWQSQTVQRTKPIDIRTDKMRRADPRLVAMADAVADRFGVPRHTIRFTVMKESGWNPNAKNPNSTATGLGQPIVGSHSAIIGRPLTRAEHATLARNPAHNLSVTAAHIRACQDARPNWSAERLWRECHIKGHANVGTSIKAARAHYRRVIEGGYEQARDINAPVLTPMAYAAVAIPSDRFIPMAFTVGSAR